MRNVVLLTRRELGAYLRSPMGYVIVAIVLAFGHLNHSFDQTIAITGHQFEGLLSSFEWEMVRHHEVHVHFSGSDQIDGFLSILILPSYIDDSDLFSSQ